MRFFISLSYDGSSLSGWQVQNNAPSVQGLLQQALTTVLRSETAVTGTGRTDAGVSGVDYIAHFDAIGEIEEPGRLLYKLNAILPREIAVNDIFRVGDDAHARFDATSRSYTYRVHTKKDPLAFHSYFCKFNIDIDKMNRAASLLLGTHDCSCFEKSGSDNKTSICTIKNAEWTTADGVHFTFRITADRFLRNMVRAIVGTLLDIGRGHVEPEWIEELFETKDRSCAGQSVPGEPLSFCGATFPYPLVSIMDNDKN